MFRQLTRTAPNKSSVFLSHEHWQYSGNAYKRLSQVTMLINERSITSFISLYPQIFILNL